MLVSTFELLVKRIAPLAPGPVDAGPNAAFRRVVQGYFLIITNLNPSRTANFFLQFTIPSLPAGSPPNVVFNREIVPGAAGNARTGFDVAAQNNVPLALNPGTATPNFKEFNTVRFSAGPLQTVSVNLLPNLGNPSVLANENLEIRGSVELIQAYTSLREIINGVPATDVLLSAETRGTFLDNEYPTATPGVELDFDQINYGLPLASGNGRNTVESLPGIFLPVFPTSFTTALALDSQLLEEARKDLIVNLNAELAPLRLAVQPLDPQQQPPAA
ncbi:MAG: hypothetical protein AVDCRST_MAG56-2739 [uncultured Cytophagales bacterium]|uniref:Uncharacterized protein n=1 Tax=uncultured Cytophagales bacterium TaxID=158755 RepID=A0A6J4IYN5_9SPHI|nr:MAG: hypothetical protein AVDCRST_MAG56-2739 [uncultured Cytophagales bacterium]